jgi:hypothetical protein
MHETASTPAVPVTPKYVPSASQRFLPASDFHSGVTGAVPMSAPVTGRSFGVAATGQPEFPSITPQLATKYGGKYKEAAVTEAGGLGGAEVLRLLASVPVENLVKKDAWDLVAGVRQASSSALLAHLVGLFGKFQTAHSCDVFFSCFFFMRCFFRLT